MHNFKIIARDLLLFCNISLVLGFSTMDATMLRNVSVGLGVWFVGDNGDG